MNSLEICSPEEDTRVVREQQRTRDFKWGIWAAGANNSGARLLLVSLLTGLPWCPSRPLWPCQSAESPRSTGGIPL